MVDVASYVEWLSNTSVKRAGKPYRRSDQDTVVFFRAKMEASRDRQLFGCTLHHPVLLKHYECNVIMLQLLQSF